MHLSLIYYSSIVSKGIHLSDGVNKRIDISNNKKTQNKGKYAFSVNNKQKEREIKTSTIKINENQQGKNDLFKLSLEESQSNLYMKNFSNVLSINSTAIDDDKETFEQNDVPENLVSESNETSFDFVLVASEESPKK